MAVWLSSLSAVTCICSTPKCFSIESRYKVNFLASEAAINSLSVELFETVGWKRDMKITEAPARKVWGGEPVPCFPVSASPFFLFFFTTGQVTCFTGFSVF